MFTLGEICAKTSKNLYANVKICSHREKTYTKYAKTYGARFTRNDPKRISVYLVLCNVPYNTQKIMR